MNKLRIVFFGELSSTFTRLHYEVLRGETDVALWVASRTTADGSAAKHRQGFWSPADFAARLGLRVSIEMQTLRHFGKPLSLLGGAECPIYFMKKRDTEITRVVSEAKPDMIISAGFSRILPHSVLELAPRGAFNSHPSLLPKFAGCNPWFWILRSGETETAATIHRMVADVDAGNIVKQRRFHLKPTANQQSFYNEASLRSALLLKECLAVWKRGETLPETPQDLSKQTNFPAPRDADFRIVWEQSAQEIANLIRAANPSPGAWTTFDGQRFIVRRIKRIEGQNVPGTITNADGRGVDVACKDAVIRIIAAARQGTREIKGHELALTFQRSIGDYLV